MSWSDKFSQSISSIGGIFTDYFHSPIVEPIADGHEECSQFKKYRSIKTIETFSHFVPSHIMKKQKIRRINTIVAQEVKHRSFEQLPI